MYSGDFIKMNNIVFRVDSSYQIGIGHVMRCITLAKAIKKKIEAKVYFFSRGTKGNINSIISSAGFDVIEMEPAQIISDGRLKHSEWLGKTPEADAEEFLILLERLAIPQLDLLIIDHYGIDYLWQDVICNKVTKTLVIDDLGDRIHQCEFLIDQTYNCKEEKYRSLVPQKCQLFLGTEYALLRDEFQSDYQEIVEKRSTSVKKNVLVMFGGADPTNHTQLSLEKINLREDISNINVILGSSAKHLNSVYEFCEKKDNINLHVSPSNIAQLMREADIAVGAAGTTSWERCASGLPSVVVIQADNQRQIAKELEAQGVITCLEGKDIDRSLNQHLDKWLSPNGLNNTIRNKCLQICDAMGSERVVKEVFDNV